MAQQKLAQIIMTQIEKYVKMIHFQFWRFAVGVGSGGLGDLSLGLEVWGWRCGMGVWEGRV